MAKTISLKLTTQEEEFVDQLRKNGQSPSMVLRAALRNYVLIENDENQAKGYNQVNQVDQIFQEKVDQGNQKGYKMVDQVNEIDTFFMGKEYKKVNQVDQFPKEKVDQDNQKGYKKVNQVDFPESKYLRLYINQLNNRLIQLENELQEWKQRYTLEGQQWKDAYAALQGEYQVQAKDMLKRIDDKFDRMLFYFDESHKPPLQLVNVETEKKESPEVLDRKKKEEQTNRKRIFPMIRM